MKAIRKFLQIMQIVENWWNNSSCINITHSFFATRKLANNWKFPCAIFQYVWNFKFANLMSHKKISTIRGQMLSWGIKKDHENLINKYKNFTWSESWWPTFDHCNFYLTQSCGFSILYCTHSICEKFALSHFPRTCLPTWIIILILILSSILWNAYYTLFAFC